MSTRDGEQTSAAAGVGVWVGDQGSVRPDHPRRALGLLWPNLPLLLTGSLLVSLTWLLVRMVAPGLSLVAVILHSLLVVPTFVALLVTCQVLLIGEHVRVSDLFRTWGRRYLRSVMATLPVTVAVLLTFAALDVWHLSGQVWMLVSVGLGLTVSVLALFSWVLALPYALGSASGSVKRWWLVGFFAASHNALPVLGVLSLAGLCVWVVQTYSIAFTFLVPALLALVWAAAFAAAADRTPVLLERGTGETPAATNPAASKAMQPRVTKPTKR
jgi:hypothetical protein